ncbi:MAG: hypothetical protein QXI93_02535 [Candidatus Methanomethylicia archaeon]
MDALFRTLPITEVGRFGKLNEYINDLLFRSLHRQIKSGKLTEEAAKNICEKLTGGYKYHDMPITKDEARNMGLNVEDLPENIKEILMEEIYN